MNAYFDWEFELIVEFGQKQVMGQCFPGLHYPDNGRIDLILSVLEYSFLSSGLFLLLWGQHINIIINSY